MTTNPKTLAASLSLIMLLAVAWPARLNWANRKSDSFPLSHYPMFSHDRQGKADMTYLVGVTANGQRHYLNYELAGTGGMNQVRKTILKRSKKDPDKLCRKVAKAVARNRELSTVRTVKIIRSQFLFNRFYAGDQTPNSSSVLCSCEVPKDVIAINKPD